MLSGRSTQTTLNKKERTRDHTDSQPSQATNESVGSLNVAFRQRIQNDETVLLG